MCYCLCAINHPEERGICTGEKNQVVIFTKGGYSGQREVLMCKRCAAETLRSQTKGSEPA
jgi:hypothetical protein